MCEQNRRCTTADPSARHSDYVQRNLPAHPIPFKDPTPVIMQTLSFSFSPLGLRVKCDCIRCIRAWAFLKESSSPGNLDVVLDMVSTRGWLWHRRQISDCSYAVIQNWHLNMAERPRVVTRPTGYQYSHPPAVVTAYFVCKFEEPNSSFCWNKLDSSICIYVKCLQIKSAADPTISFFVMIVFRFSKDLDPYHPMLQLLDPSKDTKNAQSHDHKCDKRRPVSPVSSKI